MRKRTRGDTSYQRPLVSGLFVGLLLAFLSVNALAHAKLERSEPKNNSTLQQPPQLVELWFSEELEAGLNTIEVKNQAGKRLDRGEVVLAEGNKKAQVEGFYRSVAFEAALGLVVLLVTAVLVFLTPARNHPAMENAGTGDARIPGAIKRQ